MEAQCEAHAWERHSVKVILIMCIAKSVHVNEPDYRQGSKEVIGLRAQDVKE